MLSLFGNIYYDIFILLTLAVITYFSYHAFECFGKELIRKRELKRKLWREFRFTYWELLSQLTKQEMKEMVKVFNNTFKNSQSNPHKAYIANEDVVIDFSPKKSPKKLKKRVYFDIPSRNL